jgi:hypothetical protein
VHALEPHLAAPDAGKRLFERHPALTQRFDLATGQRDPRFKAFQKFIVECLRGGCGSFLPLYRVCPRRSASGSLRYSRNPDTSRGSMSMRSRAAPR